MLEASWTVLELKCSSLPELDYHLPAALDQVW